MFYNNLLCFLVAIFVFSASNPPEKPWLPPVVALALLLASLWLFAAVAGRQFAAAASAGRYFRAERRLSFLAVGLFVVLVGLLDLKYYLQPLSLGDRLPVLTDIGGLAVFFLLLALVWHQGRRRYMQLFHSRYSAVGFLWSNLKANLPAVLPWLILSLVFDLLQLVPYPPLARFLRSAYGELALFGLFVVFLVLFFPPLVRVLWNCRPLPPGPLREHIASFCQAQGFRSEVLCWPLFEGQVLTAGIIGILPGLRYLLITPALVDNLDREELDSVLAHEIGHVRRFHLVLYVTLFLGFSLLAGGLGRLLPHFVLSGELFYQLLAIVPLAPDTLLGLLVSAPLLVLLILWFRFVFGYFMRNFERQADLHVFKVQGTGRPLVRSFERIATLGGGNREEKSWHHFGIGERVAFLERCEADPSLIARHDRKVRLSLVAFYLVIGLLAFTLHRVDGERLAGGYEVRYTEAVLAQKMRLEPGNSVWPLVLGDFLQSRRLETKAVAAYEQALTLAPDNPEIANNLAWLLLTAHDPKVRDAGRALTLAEGAALAREHGHILDTLATAYWANGLVEEALATQARAVRLDPRNRAYYLKQMETFRTRTWGEAE